jgi:hypothetical protein
VLGLRPYVIGVALAAATTGACGDSRGLPDATPAELFRVVHSYPAQGAEDVRPLDELSLTLSMPIDPASLVPGAVSVWIERAPEPIPTIIERRMAAAVTWDAAAQTIRISTLDSLPLAARVRLEAHVTDELGDPLAVSLTFRTVLGDLSREVGYFGVPPVVGQWERQLVDPGDPASRRQVRYSDAGPDLVWLTADDGVADYTASVRVDHTQYYRGQFIGSGFDGIWVTPDDDLSLWSRVELGNDRLEDRRVQMFAYGPDVTPFTPDDVIGAYAQVVRDPAGRALAEHIFDNPGLDGDWFTEDDLSLQFNWVSTVYDDEGREIGTLQHFGPGPDDVVFTDDDDVSTLTRKRYDADGRLASEEHIFAAGPDGDWLTDDDVIGSYGAVTRDDAGRPVRWTEYGGPGLDLLWHTADDEPWQYDRLTPLAKDLWTHSLAFSSPGTDNTWFTEDDLAFGGALVREYDRGVPAAVTQLQWRGDDDIWFTADDPISRVEEFDTR